MMMIAVVVEAVGGLVMNKGMPKPLKEDGKVVVAAVDVHHKMTTTILTTGEEAAVPGLNKMKMTMKAADGTEIHRVILKHHVLAGNIAEMADAVLHREMVTMMIEK